MKQFIRVRVHVSNLESVCRTCNYLLETPPLRASVLKPGFHLKKIKETGLLWYRLWYCCYYLVPHLSLAQLQRLGEFLALGGRQVLLVLELLLQLVRLLVREAHLSALALAARAREERRPEQRARSV